MNALGGRSSSSLAKAPLSTARSAICLEDIWALGGALKICPWEDEQHSVFILDNDAAVSTFVVQHLSRHVCCKLCHKVLNFKNGDFCNVHMLDTSRIFLSFGLKSWTALLFIIAFQSASAKWICYLSCSASQGTEQALMPAVWPRDSSVVVRSRESIAAVGVLASSIAARRWNKAAERTCKERMVDLMVADVDRGRL